MPPAQTVELTKAEALRSVVIPMLQAMEPVTLDPHLIPAMPGDEGFNLEHGDRAPDMPMVSARCPEDVSHVGRADDHHVSDAVGPRG
jgi:hypothetical protein